MKIATWNVNSLRVRLPQLATWFASNPVDAIALQETKLHDDMFPKSDIEALGLNVVYSGQRTYNGVAILSRRALSDVQCGILDFADEQKRVIAATLDGVRIVNVYVPNGQTPTSDKFLYKLAWLEALKGYLKTELQRFQKLVVVGDFNIAPEARDVHDPVTWEGSVLVTPQERAALQELMSLGLRDVFRQFEQVEKIYSWWDYRAAAFRRNNGLRIDLILASEALAATCTSCSIDPIPRGWERPSDHTPVIANFSSESDR